MQDPIYLRIFKVLFFVIQPEITGPLYVRLAFHDAATWNKNATNKGGRAPRASVWHMTFIKYGRGCLSGTHLPARYSEQCKAEPESATSGV